MIPKNLNRRLTRDRLKEIHVISTAECKDELHRRMKESLKDLINELVFLDTEVQSIKQELQLHKQEIIQLDEMAERCVESYDLMIDTIQKRNSDLSFAIQMTQKMWESY
jgi:predicted nuclease with TOPRIM domain